MPPPYLIPRSQLTPQERAKEDRINALREAMAKEYIEWYRSTGQARPAGQDAKIKALEKKYGVKYNTG